MTDIPLLPLSALPFIVPHTRLAARLTLTTRSAEEDT